MSAAPERHAGTIVDLCGGHGAGKTTALRQLIGETYNRVLIHERIDKQPAVYGRLNRDIDAVIFRAEGISITSLYDLIRAARLHASNVLFADERYEAIDIDHRCAVDALTALLTHLC